VDAAAAAKSIRDATRARLRNFRAQRPARRALLRARRERLDDVRAEARAKIDAHPEVQKARFRRRRRIAILVALLLALLALLSKCECEGPPPPVPQKGGEPVVADVVKPPPQPKKPVHKAMTAKVASMPRADFDVNAQKPPAWLEELRLQVAARSPRLAQCFANAEVPGALRWTASVNPGTGEVSDSVLEGNTLSVVITGTQRGCLMNVLHAPPFKLTPEGTGDALTKRVSLLVEF
jgi:hypothetical protein